MRGAGIDGALFNLELYEVELIKNQKFLKQTQKDFCKFYNYRRSRDINKMYFDN